MGTGYVRNDAANNIADGNIINASDLDGEFDAVEAAFNSTTGHTHDGTSAEGAPIEVIGPTQDVVITASVMRPKTTNTVDLGTSSLEFKDAYFDGTITTDALTVTDGITSDTVTVLSENAGAAKGPQLDIFRDSASPADSDVLGYIDFSGKDDGDNKTIYASILAEAADVTDTTEDGVLKFNTMVAGSDTTTMTITESKVGILDSNPDGALHVYNGMLQVGSKTGDTSIQQNTNAIRIAAVPNSSTEWGGLQWYREFSDVIGAEIIAERASAAETDTDLIFKTSTNSSDAIEVMRIDHNGRIIKGHNSSLAVGGVTPTFQIHGDGFNNSSMLLVNYANDANPAIIQFGKSREGTVGTPGTILQDGDNIGNINWAGDDGTDINTPVARISGQVDGTPSANDIPGRLVFLTSTGGSQVERMRIDSSGNVGIGVTPSAWDILPSIQVSDYGGLSAGGGYTRLSSNAYLSTYPNTWSRINTNNASLYEQLQGQHVWSTAASGSAGTSISFDEAMRIDSSGNLLVGKTSASFSTAGHELRAGAAAIFVRDGNDCLSLNRLTSDGDIAKFSKDGTTVGSIGVASSDNLYIGASAANHAGVYFGTNINYPMTAGSISDGLVDLGNSTARYKDLYLSGGLRGDTTFKNNAGTTEYARFDSSGHFVVGGTSSGANSATTLYANGLVISRSTDIGGVIIADRDIASDGTIISFRKQNATVGSIRTDAGKLGIDASDTNGLNIFINGTNEYSFDGTRFYPLTNGTNDLGLNGFRFRDIYATNGTISTSDENEKQQIASLTDAEMIAAKAISKLFKTFKWNDAVSEKGDAARTHTGVIAQQVQTAMSDAGLDAGNYAFFISTTWWQGDDGEPYDTQEEAPEGATERTEMGVRYHELLSFIGAATEQRLTSIEARLDALEA